MLGNSIAEKVTVAIYSKIEFTKKILAVPTLGDCWKNRQVRDLFLLFSARIVKGGVFRPMSLYFCY